MSEAVEHTASPCDRLLDYVYGELAGDDLEQFKLHLLTCDKCKRELQGLERVRSAVKSAMPAVEPPVDKMAQLMHAAAQQKPKRGKVLTFARRVISHPAYAAAAVFVIVGGAVVVNFSAGRVSMPSPEKVVHEQVKTPEVTTALPPPAPMMPIEEKAAQPAADAPKPIELLAKDKSKEPKIVLKTDPMGGAYTVRREIAKEAPAKKASMDDGRLLQQDFDDARKDQPASAGKMRSHASSNAGERAKMADEKNDSGGYMQAQPPPPPAPKPKAEAKTGERERDISLEGRVNNQAPGEMAPQVAQNQVNRGAGGQAAAPTTTANVTPAAPPPAQAAPALASESRAQTKGSSAGLDNNNSYGNPANYKQQKSDPALLKKQAMEAANSGRCEEAQKLFERLDREYPNYLASKDRAELTRCRSVRDNNQNQMANEEQAAPNKSNAAPHAAKKPAKAKPAAAPADKAAY